MDKTQEIRKALEAATPGPWNVRSSYYGVTRYDVISRDFEIRFYNKDNAHLIANAPEWLSYLLTELDTVNTKLKDYEGCKGIEDYYTVLQKCRELQQENERLRRQRAFAVKTNHSISRNRRNIKKQLKTAVEAIEATYKFANERRMISIYLGSIADNLGAFLKDFREGESHE